MGYGNVAEIPRRFFFASLQFYVSMSLINYLYINLTLFLVLVAILRHIHPYINTIYHHKAMMIMHKNPGVFTVDGEYTKILIYDNLSIDIANRNRGLSCQRCH